uniref:Uncharacterized protein n=1 Tax=Arundo donax TaxID=35708 RepID=A0A0A9D0V1_ARUDO
MLNHTMGIKKINMQHGKSSPLNHTTSKRIDESGNLSLIQSKTRQLTFDFRCRSVREVQF